MIHTKLFLVKKMLLLLLSVFILTLSTYAQTDTSYHFYDIDWNECSKNAAVYYGKTFKEEHLWHRLTYYTRNSTIQMDAFYADEESTIKQDTAKYYWANGILAKIEYFENGERIYIQCWYPSGKEKGYIQFYNNGALPDIKGLHEDGSPMPDSVCYIPARYSEDKETWQSYLQKELTAGIEKLKRKPAIKGEVTVSFIIDRDGNVSQVEMEKSSNSYHILDECILNIIKKSRAWTPETLFGEKVDVKRKQKINILPQ